MLPLGAAGPAMARVGATDIPCGRQAHRSMHAEPTPSQHCTACGRGHRDWLQAGWLHRLSGLRSMARHVDRPHCQVHAHGASVAACRAERHPPICAHCAVAAARGSEAGLNIEIVLQVHREISVSASMLFHALMSTTAFTSHHCRGARSPVLSLHLIMSGDSASPAAFPRIRRAPAPAACATCLTERAAGAPPQVEQPRQVFYQSSDIDACNVPSDDPLGATVNSQMLTTGS